MQMMSFFLDFNREYLRNRSRHQQSVNGDANCNLYLSCPCQKQNAVNFGSLTKQIKICIIFTHSKSTFVSADIAAVVPEFFFAIWVQIASEFARLKWASTETLSNVDKRMQELKVPLYPYHDIINYTNNHSLCCLLSSGLHSCLFLVSTA